MVTGRHARLPTSSRSAVSPCNGPRSPTSTSDRLRPRNGSLSVCRTHRLSVELLHERDQTRQAQAVGWSLVAALGFSSVPIAAHLFAGDADPFMYTAALLAAAAAAMGVWLAACGQPLRSLTVTILRTAAAARQQGTRGCVIIAALLLGTVDESLFVVSVHHAGPVAATVLYQLWPLSAAVLLAERDGPRIRRLRGSTVALMAASFAVTATAVASQSAGTDSRGIWWLGVASGAAAGVLGGAVMSGTASVGYHAARRRGPGDDYDAAQTAAVMIAAVMVWAVAAAAVNTVVAAVSGGFVHGLRPAAASGAALAGFVSGGGACAARVALVRCSGLGIFAVQGLGIVLASVWLALAGAGFRHGWLFAGCVAVLAAVNALIQTNET